MKSVRKRLLKSCNIQMVDSATSALLSCTHLDDMKASVR